MRGNFKDLAFAILLSNFILGSRQFWLWHTAWILLVVLIHVINSASPDLLYCLKFGTISSVYNCQTCFSMKIWCHITAGKFQFEGSSCCILCLKLSDNKIMEDASVFNFEMFIFLSLSSVTQKLSSFLEFLGIDFSMKSMYLQENPVTPLWLPLLSKMSCYNLFLLGEFTWKFLGSSIFLPKVMRLYSIFSPNPYFLGLRAQSNASSSFPLRRGALIYIVKRFMWNCL